MPLFREETTMQAVLMTAIGTPDVLQVADISEPKITQATEVKVKIHAAGVNPIDTKLRRNGILYNNPLPVVLGCDAAGEVVAVGGAVDRFRVGDKVWFFNGGLGQEQGCYAQYAVIDQRWLATMPHNVDYPTAAAGPLVLITAWGALFDRGGLQEGQTVLIHAGAGGVGHVAIQLAKLRGAKVIATVSNSAKADLVKMLGADVIINYKTQDVVAEVYLATGGLGADVVIDTVGPEVFKQSIAATAHFGRLITLLDYSGVELKEARLRNLLLGFELMLTPMLRKLDGARERQIAMLDQCAQWIEQGVLKIHVSEILPLEQAAQAHQLIEAGHVTGKIVLLPQA